MRKKCEDERDEKEIKDGRKVVVKRREKTEERKLKCYPRIELSKGVPCLCIRSMLAYVLI